MFSIILQNIHKIARDIIRTCDSIFLCRQQWEYTFHQQEMIGNDSTKSKAKSCLYVLSLRRLTGHVFVTRSFRCFYYLSDICNIVSHNIELFKRIGMLWMIDHGRLADPRKQIFSCHAHLHNHRTTQINNDK